jgi:molecular chaperone GrpE
MSDKTNSGPHGPMHRVRHKTRAQERIEALEAVEAQPPQSAPAESSAPSAPPVDFGELQGRAERAELEAAENLAAWQRTAADFSNYRRRTEQQREEEIGFANESLLLKVLAVADDFDRALSHVPPDQADSPWVEGITAIDRKLRALLESQGLTPIVVEGEPFDPRLHDAIAQEETTEVPDGTVIRELQRGYRIRDRVLRPALVAVAKNDQG